MPLDVLELAVIAEEIAEASVYPGIMNQGISMLVPTLLEVGTEASRCANGSRPPSAARSSGARATRSPAPAATSPPPRRRAVVEDGHFVINGQKIWTSSAHYSDMMFLLCRTEPDKAKHAGLSATCWCR